MFLGHTCPWDARIESAGKPYQGEPSALLQPSWPQEEMGGQSSWGRLTQSLVPRLLLSIICFHGPTHLSAVNRKSHPLPHAWVQAPERLEDGRTCCPGGGVRRKGDAALRGPRRACLQVATSHHPSDTGADDTSPEQPSHSHTRVSVWMLFRGHGKRG